MNPNDIKSVSPGDLLSAGRDEEILQALRRRNSGVAIFEGALGWHFFRPLQVLGRYAKAVADWEENGVYPNGDPRVSCRHCYRDGTVINASEEPFWVYLPRNPPPTVGQFTHDADPAVYEGFRIYYEPDCEETLICRSPYLHMGKIKDVKILAAINTIPPGWGECDGSQKIGPAGTFNLVDFKTAQDSGFYGPGNQIVARMPRHYSAEEPITTIGNNLGFDALGFPPVYPGDDGLPAHTDGGDTLDTGTGSYKVVAVMFIERYK